MTDDAPEPTAAADSGPPSEPEDRRPVVPYGEWPSTIRIDDLVTDAVRLDQPWVDGDDVYWIEGRPSEDGRSVLVRRTADGTTEDVTPAPIDVRSRVHEYGGGAYTVAGGTIVYSDRRDGRLYRLGPGDGMPVALTPEGPFRYADLRIDPARRRTLAVREDHGVGGQAAAAIVAIPLDGDQEPTVLVAGPDFLAAPRLAPDGSHLAWLEWDHPDMPWDTTRLRVAPVLEDGTLGRAELAAGGHDESVVEPEWSPDGVLHFVSDRSGWWNLYRLLDGPRLDPLAAMEAEFAVPSWVFDRPRYGFLADGSIVAIARSAGRDRLFHIAPGQLIGEVETAFTEFGHLRIGMKRIVTIAASPTEARAVVALDPETLAPIGILRHAAPTAPDPSTIALAEPIAFPTTDGATSHALSYRPTNPAVAGTLGERPPLVVLSHGGPTANASSALDLEIQLLTSRGIAVVDVDYRGSTGYGRAYRQALEGRWGIVDVDDCVAAARFLVERGDVDGDRLAIAGGSAGGYTTLAALAFRDVFAAGISAYGIGDLETLARDTHKFESRYMDRLVGPYPAMADRYRRRSPIHALDHVSCPVLVLQGLDDRVVPPSQAEAMIAALSANGIPHAYLAFEGEGHGFRGADAIRRATEARIAFLGRVLGFEPADALEPLDVPGVEAWRARRAGRSTLTRAG